jgi:hypothetical protein
VYCRTLSPTDTLFNGAVYFFVGEWMTNGNMAFYRHSTPVTVTRTIGCSLTIDLRQGCWVTISNVNGRRWNRCIRIRSSTVRDRGRDIVSAVNWASTTSVRWRAAWY